jgi:uncharacterized protein YbjT (DUF2867 family)
MYIVLGATGHVGSAVANALLDRKQAVTVVTRNAASGTTWAQRGAKVAVVDVHEVEKLRALFREGKRAFLLNPPANPAGDTDAEERETVRCLLAAVKDSGLEKIVAQSTYGAHPGERCGDLTVLFEFEEGLRAQSIPTEVVRAAYYMSNWDTLFPTAKDTGVLPSFYPAQLKIPMVAAEDLGEAAARLLTEPIGKTGIHFVEGPERYSSTDVAAAFSRALGKLVKVEVTPREKWVDTYRTLGFSAEAAESFARMMAYSLDDDYETPTPPIRGKISLQQYVETLARRSPSPHG